MKIAPLAILFQRKNCYSLRRSAPCIINNQAKKLIFIILCFYALNAKAQPNSNFFELNGVSAELKTYTIQEGLPDNVVHCGTQDKYGFIWLGTRAGLVRFDGQNFLSFSTNDGLPANSVSRIEKLQDDWLWLICGDNPFDLNTGGEIVLFNVLNHQIQKLSSKFPSIAHSHFKDIKPIGDTAFVLYTTKSKFIIYSPTAGLTMLPKRIDTDNNFLISPNGLLWVSQLDSASRKNFRLLAFDLNGDIVYSINVENQTSSAFFLAGFNSEGWPIGITDNLLNTKTILASVNDKGTLETVSNFLTNAVVKTKIPSYGKQINLGGTSGIVYRDDNKGLCYQILAAKSKSIVLIEPDILKTIPSSDLRFSLFVTPKNQLWICARNGLTKVVLRKNQFRQILSTNIPSQAQSIRGIQTDKNQNLFVSCSELGFVKIDTTGLLTKIHTSPCISILYDEPFIYFSNENRLFRYSSEYEDLPFYPIKETGHIWSIYKAKDGKWWIGGIKGAVRFAQWNEPDTANKILLLKNENAITYQMFENNNLLWLATSKGLYSYSEKTKLLEKISLTKDDKELLDDIHQVHIQNDTWWVSTKNNGLIQWHPKTKQFNQFTVNDGLPSNTLYASYADSFGRIWISTNYGLAQFNPATRRIITYGIDDGIAHTEFNRASWHRDSKGNLYFGGINGLITFKPENFSSEKEPYQPHLQLTRFVQYYEKTQQLENITLEVRQSKQIILKPSSGYFSLQCQLLDYLNDSKHYYYQINGISTDWALMDHNTLTLSGLPYGRFKLRIKAQNEAREWSPHQLEFDVLVLKPFYLKFWFIAIASIGILAVVLAIVKWRTRRLQKARNKLQQTVEQQTEKLTNALQEKEMLLKEVHHRVKNNLQIISSLLNLERTAGHDDQTMTLLNEARNRIKSMALIHKNLYQNEDLAHVTVEPYLNDLLRSLHETYKIPDKKISYELSSTVTNLDIDKAIPIGLIITELISNSYKYAFTDKDEGKISISLHTTTDFMVLKVSDNGKGFNVPSQHEQLKSLGLRIIGMLTKQLKGSYEVKTDSGADFIFNFKT
ncbi:hypothetical protein GC194_00170 [bacterium]|nr:hypothetical protein [bacterium]